MPSLLPPGGEGPPLSPLSSHQTLTLELPFDLLKPLTVIAQQQALFWQVPGSA